MTWKNANLITFNGKFFNTKLEVYSGLFFFFALNFLWVLIDFFCYKEKYWLIKVEVLKSIEHRLNIPVLIGKGFVDLENFYDFDREYSSDLLLVKGNSELDRFLWAVMY